MTDGPRKEVETQLKEWGCPYDVMDDRCLIWLDGFKAGSADAFKVARVMAHEVFNNMGQKS